MTLGLLATPVLRAKLPAVWVVPAQPRSTPTSRECQGSPELIHPLISLVRTPETFGTFDSVIPVAVGFTPL
jgi:hypothetical protein